MTPLVVWSMCKRKVRHPDKKTARRELRKSGPSFRGCHVYHCPICKGWHVGHKKARP